MTSKSPLEHGRRSKYTTRACWDCRQRKVKCSGLQPCSNCVGRGATCNYFPRRERGNKDPQFQRPRTASINAVAPSRNSTSDQTGQAEQMGQPPKHNPVQLDGSGTTQDERRPSQVKPYRLLMKEPEPPKAQFQGHASPASIDLTLHSPKDPDLVVMATNEDEMDTFNLQLQAGNSITLSSQLMSLGKILGAGPPLSPPASDKTGPPSGPVLSLQLPHLGLLQDLTEVFFREMNTLLPMLDQHEAIPRMTRTLKALGYNERTGKISSCTGHAIFLGIIFNILAIAESETADLRGGTERSGWNWFQQGQRLARYFPATGSDDLDRVCYYTSGAVYLLRLECSSHASAYIMQAWNAATMIGLNNQRSWPRASHSINLMRQKLWWSLYYMDTHAARRQGRPYLIRDNEVAVAEFLPQLSLTGKRHGQEPTSVHVPNFSLGDSAMRDMEYWQIAINYGRLWKQIWDTLFSARLGHYADAQDVEVLDARILFLESLTPSNLRWEVDKGTCQQHVGEPEALVRRRLLCQLQLHLFRMIIRQNPLRQIKVSQHDKEICVSLAKKNIAICAAYVAAYRESLRPAANLLTLHLSEILYHLTYALCDGDSVGDPLEITDSFKTAYGLLKKLAKCFHGSRKALGAITVSFCALKRTVIGSSTLAHLVDLVYKERDALVNTSPANEANTTTHRQRDMSNMPHASPSLSQTPVSVNTNDGIEMEIDLDHPLGQDNPGLQWPVINNLEMGMMDSFSWPELELTLERQFLNRWAPAGDSSISVLDDQQWAMLGSEQVSGDYANVRASGLDSMV